MSDPCRKIRDKVASSKEKVADLKSEMTNATGALLHGLAGKLTQAQKQLARDQQALAACEKTASPPSPPSPPSPGRPPAPPAGPSKPPKDPCADKRTKVAQSKETIADLKDQIQGATGPVLHGLAGRLNQVLNQLAAEEEALAACEGKLPPPVAPKPITIGVDRIVCLSESSEAGSDEPYVLVLAVDMTSTINVTAGGVPVPVTFPSLRVTLVGPWDDVDEGETHSAAELDPSARKPFWNLTGKLQLADPSRTIFLVALMENDDASPASIRTDVQGILTGNLYSNMGLGRDALAQQLRDDMDAAINSVRSAGSTFPFNFDDQIGSTQLLNITAVDIDRATRNGSATRNLTFSGDDAFYQVFFNISTSALS